MNKKQRAELFERVVNEVKFGLGICSKCGAKDLRFTSKGNLVKHADCSCRTAIKPVGIIPMGESPIAGAVETATLIDDYYKQIALAYGVPAKLLEISHTCERSLELQVLDTTCIEKRNHV